MKMHCLTISWSEAHSENASFLTSEIMKAVHGYNSRSSVKTGAVAAPVFRQENDEINAGVVMLSAHPLDGFFLHARIAATCEVESIEFEPDANNVSILVSRARYKSPSQARREAAHRAERFGTTEAEKQKIYQETFDSVRALHITKRKGLTRNFATNPYFWFASKSREGSSPSPVFWKISKSNVQQARADNTLGFGTTILPKSLALIEDQRGLKLIKSVG